MEGDGEGVMAVTAEREGRDDFRKSQEGCSRMRYGLMGRKVIKLVRGDAGIYYVYDFFYLQEVKIC